MPLENLSPAVRAAVRQRCREIYKEEARKNLKRGREDEACSQEGITKSVPKIARGGEKNIFLSMEEVLVLMMRVIETFETEKLTRLMWMKLEKSCLP